MENSIGGEEIKFKVTTDKKGYKIGSIKIRTDSGEEVEFSEEEITKNEDGTISISNNKFTMPFENVTIEARWEAESILENPKTVSTIGIVALMITLISATFILTKKKKIG